MKTLLIAVCAIMGWFCVDTTAWATNPAMALVTHPVYLGADADPNSIPFSAVAVWHNYGFGVHSVISNPRIFPVGILVSEAGLHFDMNLASVYDIEVAPEDPTQVPLMPVTLKVGNRALPAEARHSRTQALVATLWSLVLNAPGTEKQPLVVNIDSQDESHQAFAGEYVMDPERLKLTLGDIRGSQLVRDDRGVLMVTFPTEEEGAKKAKAASAPQLAFVPLLSGGGAEGNEHVALVPHWTSNQEGAQPMQLLWAANPRAMQVLSAKHGANANPLHSGLLDTQNPGDAPGELRFYGSTASPDELAFDDQRLFATACHAAIVTHATSEDAPYKITFSGYPVKLWEVLEGDEWKMTEGKHGHVTWHRTFTTSSQSILGHRLIPRAAGGWWLEYSEPELPEMPAE